MTAIADIIEGAFFESGLTNELQHPTPTQTEKAMRTLSGIIDFLYGTDVGEHMQPFPLGDYGRETQSRGNFDPQFIQRPPINSQLIATNNASMTVYLPVNPSDGARIGVVDPFSRLASVPITLDGNGRTIGGAAQHVVNTNGTSQIWLYRADLANWVPVTPLEIADDMPFPSDYDRMFTYLLAVQLSPAYGNAVNAVQAQFLKEYRQQFRARYVQSAPLQINHDISFPTLQSYDNFANAWYGGSTEAWARGWGWQ